MLSLEWSLPILSPFPYPVPASGKDAHHGHQTPEHSPRYQGKKQVTNTGSVEEGTR